MMLVLVVVGLSISAATALEIASLASNESKLSFEDSLAIIKSVMENNKSISFI